MEPGAALLVPVLVVMTSALGVRAVVTVAALLLGVRSSALELLLAVLETLTPVGAMKLMVRVVLA